jgi:preprotein translocase subunit SecD
MIRKLFLGLSLLAGSALLGVCALWCAQGAREDLARPAKRVRLVCRFDGSGDPHVLELAREVMRERLKAMEAAEITVERRGQSEVVAEFRPLLADSVNLEGELGHWLAARGELRFLVAASSADFARPGSPLNGEREKFESWCRSHPNDSLDAFHALAPEAGGPARGLWWGTWIREPSDDTDPISAPTTAAERNPIPLLAPKAEWTFGGADLQSVRMAEDERGHPAVAFAIQSDRASAFGDFTASIVNEGLAIVLDGDIIMLATVQSRMPGSVIINGGAAGFTMNETRRLVALLRSGSLPSNPLLVASEQVPAARSWRWLLLAVVSFVSAVSALALAVLAVRSVRTKPVAVSEKWS